MSSLFGAPPGGPDGPAPATTPAHAPASIPRSRNQCLHCRKRPPSRRKHGLCAACWRAPSIRDLYPNRIRPGCPPGRRWRWRKPGNWQKAVRLLYKRGYSSYRIAECLNDCAELLAQLREAGASLVLPVGSWMERVQYIKKGTSKNATIRVVIEDGDGEFVSLTPWQGAVARDSGYPVTLDLLIADRDPYCGGGAFTRDQVRYYVHQFVPASERRQEGPQHDADAFEDPQEARQWASRGRAFYRGWGHVLPGDPPPRKRRTKATETEEATEDMEAIPDGDMDQATDQDGVPDDYDDCLPEPTWEGLTLITPDALGERKTVPGVDAWDPVGDHDRAAMAASAGEPPPLPRRELTPREVSILDALAEHPEGMTARDLCEVLGLSRPPYTRGGRKYVLTALAEAGLVLRESRPGVSVIYTLAPCVRKHTRTTREDGTDKRLRLARERQEAAKC